MPSQSHTLHRAVLRPFILHTLRAAGFHSTKPSVLDTLLNLTERHLLLLASTTAHFAAKNHNEPEPTIGDVREAMSECGVLIPYTGGEEEGWKEVMRSSGQGEKRKRDEDDVADLRPLLAWVGSETEVEIRRVAGMESSVGVGGGVVQSEDWLERLRKKHKGASSVGEGDGRLAGSVLARARADGEERGVVVEGGDVGRVSEWRPRRRDQGEAG